jgi:hypothetical protein
MGKRLISDAKGLYVSVLLSKDGKRIKEKTFKQKTCKERMAMGMRLISDAKRL